MSIVGRVGDLPATGVCGLTTGDRGEIAGGKENRRGKVAEENRRGLRSRGCVGAGDLMIVGFEVALI